MITRFHVENFKSLAKFDLPPAGHRLGPFTCLIGLNGSGKSTLLQAFDFAAHIVTGKVEDWLKQRNWKPSDVVTNLGKRTFVVCFEVGFRDETGREATWSARYNASQLRCTWEKVESNGRPLLELESERLSLAGTAGELSSSGEKLDLDYKGSVLSVLQLKEKHPLLTLVKESLKQLKSLELLSPQLLRKRAYAAEDIGVGGEKLSAFLAGLAPHKKAALSVALQQFYPHLESWRVQSLQSGWKDLRVVELYEGRHTVQAAHMNDGFLRTMAILAQVHSPHTFLLFDEIENGINPELVEKLVDFLITCGKQIVVTTHSPMILNYLPDNLAKEGVILLYKTQKGETRSGRFFDLPVTQEKLRALGPGEVFVDTRQSDLAAELEQQPNGSSANSPQS